MSKQVLLDVRIGLNDSVFREFPIQEQRRYLLCIHRDFSTLMKSAVDGTYNDPFFGNAKTTEGYRKRLRAVVQNALTDFREEIQANGHARTVIEMPPDN